MIKPPPGTKMKPDPISSMFDNIAPRYDSLNRLLSLRRDVYWRSEMVRALGLPDSARVLDVACGTGDVLLEVMRRKPDARTYGADFSKNMLQIAAGKIAGLAGAPVLVAADALHLPFSSNRMDAVTIAFGIRNISDREKALRNFREVLKDDGILAVLELNMPTGKMFRALYLFYFQKVLPGIGGLFSKNTGAYQYLPASVLNFPPPEDFAALMRGAGFRDIAWKSLTGGIATLYTGRK
jgi:demethylmenaquinone methyltransferase / 2-methoxy-6-polyprenyl-1,4-benzoquinol methylase